RLFVRDAAAVRRGLRVGRDLPALAGRQWRGRPRRGGRRAARDRRHREGIPVPARARHGTAQGARPRAARCDGFPMGAWHGGAPGAIPVSGTKRTHYLHEGWQLANTPAGAVTTAEALATTALEWRDA